MIPQRETEKFTYYMPIRGGRGRQRVAGEGYMDVCVCGGGGGGGVERIIIIINYETTLETRSLE